MDILLDGRKIFVDPVLDPNHPFAYFKFNDGWKTWQQVTDDHAGEEGVVASYTKPVWEMPANALKTIEIVVSFLCAVKGPGNGDCSYHLEHIFGI